MWEALMFAAHYRLDNMCVIIDHNGLQIDGTNEKVMGLGSIPDKLRAFGLNVFQIDGQGWAGRPLGRTPGKPAPHTAPARCGPWTAQNDPGLSA